MKNLTIIAAATSLLTGCFWATTKSEGDAIRTDVKHLNGRLDEKEKQLDDQIAKLKQVLDDAQTALRKNNAGLGADVDGLRGELRQANGLVVSVNQNLGDLKTAFDAYRKASDARLDAIEQRLGVLESGKPAANSSPDEMWRLGTQAFTTQRWTDAIEIYKRLQTTYPTDKHAPDALYFKGQAYGNLKDFDHAIGAYQSLYDKYPDSSFADDGLYFAALASKELKNCTEGRTYLAIIKTKYPKSNVIKETATLDNELKKTAKTKSACNT